MVPTTTTTAFTPLVRRLLGGIGPARRSISGEGRGQCPHCNEERTVWPCGLWADQGPFLCTGCGGLMSAEGTALEVSPSSARIEARGAIRRAEAARALVSTLELGARWKPGRRIAGRYERVEAPELTRYLQSVRGKLGAKGNNAISFIDLGEPALAALPGGDLVVSLGLLATLEDEAQLAFFLAREDVLEEAGWPLRRLSSCSSRPGALFLPPKRREGRAVAELLQLSFRVGYGARAEALADREGLGILVRAGYDPAAAPRALRLVEGACLAGKGGRFLLASERARWLEEGAGALGGGASALLNREVYRRAVGGFAVFAH